MVRSPFSVRFIDRVGLTSTASYTVPPGYRAVVRDLDVYQGITVSTNKVTFQGRLTQTIWEQHGGGDNDTYGSWRGRQVFYAGETFAIVSNDGFEWDVTLSGYLLIDDAPSS